MRLSDLRSNLACVEDTQFIAGIYPRKQLSLIASAPGLGKTWLIIKQALDMANGGKVFAAEETAPLKTLIFCGEAGSNIMAERIRKLGITPDNIPKNFVVYTYATFTAKDIDLCLDSPEGMKNFMTIIDGEKPDAVFIDTLISFRSDDENASKETARLLGKLRSIADINNCAIVIMHHVRKRKLRDKLVEATQDEIIGTSAFTRLSAVAFMLSEVPMSKAVKFFCVKSWYQKPEPIIWKISANGENVSLVVTEDSQQQSNALQDALAFIDNLYPSKTMITSDLIQEKIGCSKATANRAIKQATEDGIIELYWQDKQQRYYRKL